MNIVRLRLGDEPLCHHATDGKQDAATLTERPRWVRYRRSAVFMTEWKASQLGLHHRGSRNPAAAQAVLYTAAAIAMRIALCQSQNMQSIRPIVHTALAGLGTLALLFLLFWGGLDSGA